MICLYAALTAWLHACTMLWREALQWCSEGSDG